MKKYFLALIVLLPISLLFLLACQKEADQPVIKTKTELISSSPWVFQSATASGFGDISAFPQISCFIDNIITMNANGTGTINEGANICSPSTAGNFTWNFTTNETKLDLSTIIVPNGSTTFDIVTLNETNLAISQTVNLPPSSTVTITFKH